MSRFSADVRRSILDLVWSLWTECGVAGWKHGSGDVAVDVEALILSTAELGDHDARLRDEAADWCIRYGHLVSTVRLKNIRKMGLGAVPASDAFAATVNAQATLGWPDGGARARRLAPSRRSALDLQRPSVAQLRARAVFGVTARAELLTLFAIDGTERTATRLAERISFGRRITVDAADLLVSAGLLEVRDQDMPRRYVLRRHDEVRSLLGPLPTRTSPWAHVFRVLAAVHAIATNGADQTPVVRAVETRKRLLAIDESALRAGFPHIPTLDATPSSWTRFTEWASDVLERAAG
jgi:hypothetical protein